MRAVNLIPSDSVRAGGRSGGGAYLVLVVLAALVAGVSYYVLTSNAIADRHAQLAQLQVQTRAAQAQADATRPYRDFAVLAQARVQTVRQLGAARFDWHRALSQLSRVMPDDVWLSSLLGTVAPGVSVDGGDSGATSALRSALPNPAIEMTGCTTSHDSVVRLISRLRLIDGVQRVALADSTKDTAAASTGGGGGAGGGSTGDCRHGHPNLPQFDLVIFFAPLPAVPSPSGGGGSASAATGAQPAAAQSAPAASSAAAPTPAASTTPAPPPTGSSTGSNVR